MILLIKLDHVQDLHLQCVSYFQQLKFKYFFPSVHNFTFFILSLLKEKSGDHFLEFEYLIHYLFTLIIHAFHLLLFLDKKSKFRDLLIYFITVNSLLIKFLILILFLRKYLQNYFKQFLIILYKFWIAHLNVIFKFSMTLPLLHGPSHHFLIFEVFSLKSPYQPIIPQPFFNFYTKELVIYQNLI